MNYKRLAFLVGSALFLVVALFILVTQLADPGKQETTLVPFVLFVISVLIGLWLLSEAGDPNIYGITIGKVEAYVSQPPSYWVSGRAWRFANRHKPTAVCWMRIRDKGGKVGYLPFFVSASDMQIKWPVGSTYNPRDRHRNLSRRAA